MKSFSIHNIEPDLAAAIEQIVETSGKSYEEVVKMLLRRSLNLIPQGEPKRDVSAFFGIWTQEEADDFNEAIKFLD